MKKKQLIIICAALLFVLFVYAAWAKLADYYNFQYGLSESPLISPFAGFFSWAIPASEFVIGLLLVVPYLRLAGFWSATIMLVLFTLYIGGMLVWGKEIPCSCGGVIEKLSWGEHIVFNCFFVLAGITGIISETRRRQQLYKLMQA